MPRCTCVCARSVTAAAAAGTHAPTHGAPARRWELGAPFLTRVDAGVSFDWAASVAFGGPQYQSVIWTGYVRAPVHDTMVFTVLTSDGARLYVDGVLVIDALDASGLGAVSGTSPLLSAAQLYRISLEYRETSGRRMTALYWASSMGAVSYSPVPPAWLHPVGLEIVHSPFSVTAS